MSTETELHAVYVGGKLCAAYPRRRQAEVYASGFSGKDECRIVRGVFAAQETEQPKHPTQVGGEFYNGMEWLGAWLVDHAEGETITEELVHRWAVEAWKEHLKRQPASAKSSQPLAE